MAVSGGVDSMVLLDMLAGQPGLELVVAHFDHGIRADSAADAKLVAKAAKHYGLAYEIGHGNLGSGASEDQARRARYAFLHAIRQQYGAQAIVTAHHQDDVLETMVLNIVRGTGRKGLASLTSRHDVVRPLLDVTKDQIRHYAHEHAITWHEDSTNVDTAYLRNYFRHMIMPRLAPTQRLQLLAIHKKARAHNQAIDAEVADLFVALGGPDKLERHGFIMLPHVVAREVMAAWLRAHLVTDISSKQIERLVTAAKTARPGAIYDIDKRKIMNISRKFLEITPRNSRKHRV